MKNWCKDKMLLLLSILVTFFLICVVELKKWYYTNGALTVRGHQYDDYFLFPLAQQTTHLLVGFFFDVPEKSI